MTKFNSSFPIRCKDIDFRLSVIEEALGETVKASSNMSNESSQPNLSQYFGTPGTAAGNESGNTTGAAGKEEFFDNFSKVPPSSSGNGDSSDAMMHSCRESGVDLTGMAKKASPPKDAEITVSAQATDDERSLQRRISEEGEMSQAFSNVTISTTPRPTSLPSAPLQAPLVTNTLPTPTTTPSNVSSSYATPVAPTPVTPIFSVEGLAYSTYSTTPFNSNVPITSPLPMTTATPTPAAVPQPSAQVPVVVEDEESNLSAEEIRERDLWIISEAVRKSLNDRNVDRSMLTSAIVQGREEIQDPIRNMVLHYRGESEAAKRNVLTANDVSPDINGLNRLIRAGCLRAAVNLTSRLLTKPPLSTQHCPTSLKIWHVRIALLLKLKQLTTVESEASAFGNLEQNVDLYFQYYPEQYGTRQGSMVPFGFRVLLAELPMHVGKPLDAMDRLYSLLALVDKLIQTGTFFYSNPDSMGFTVQFH